MTNRKPNNKIMGAPFLNWLENCAIRFLISSPRVSFLSVKQHGFNQMYVVQDPTDLQVVALMQELSEPMEPLSMQLERLYHEPAYGESE
jgi:hypothetical protein